MMKQNLLLLILLFPVMLMAQGGDFKKQKSAFSKGLDVENINFEVGSSVGSTFNDSWFLSNYFSPSATFNHTERFSTQVGIGTSFSQFNNVPLLTNEFTFEKQDITKLSFYAYVAGNYKINKNLNVYSQVLVEDATFNHLENSQVINRQYKDVSVGFNYKIAPKVTINAEINISDRPYSTFGNYSSQPFGNSHGFGFPNF